MSERYSEGFAVTDEGEEVLTFTRAEFDAWVAEHDARMRTREPSDAQVLAALNGEQNVRAVQGGYKPGPCSETLSDWDRADVSRMRATLRAALSATGGAR